MLNLDLNCSGGASESPAAQGTCSPRLGLAFFFEKGLPQRPGFPLRAQVTGGYSILLNPHRTLSRWVKSSKSC